MENFDRLSYDAETGVFTWIASQSGRVKVGDVAGCDNGLGYLQIRYRDKNYRAHRLAWFITHGKWPDGDIDHINGKRSDNRIANLRDVSRSVNLQNQRKPRAGSKSGFLGVGWNKSRGKWMAYINIDGKVKYLGYFDDPAIAHEAYLTAKRSAHKGCTI